MVLSGWGNQADWYRNIQAAPALEIATAGERYVPKQRFLDAAELYSCLLDYLNRNWPIRPLVCRVLGLTMDGSDADRAEMEARGYRGIAFRPVRTRRDRSDEDGRVFGVTSWLNYPARNDVSRVRTAVVLDTNVFVAAGFNPRSDSARIVDAVRAGRLQMVWNRATRAETEYILRRIPRLSGTTFGDLFRESNRFRGAVPPDHQFANVSDPADRKFVALATAASAVLVTNDALLLRSLTTISVRGLRPGEWLRDCCP